MDNSINNSLSHLAIIMDGNRRWARQHNKPIKDGHKVGANKLLEVIEWCLELEIKYLTVYAFSTENWNRSEDEITDLFSLLKEFLIKKSNIFTNKGVKIKVIGTKDKIDNNILKEINRVERETDNNNKIQVNIAFNYGGRREILDVTKKICLFIKNNILKLEEIDEKLFEDNLYFGNIPDPDLVVRTGNTRRISNFLLWEIAYSELFFIDAFWPDFTKEALINIINDFKKIERKYGGK